MSYIFATSLFRYLELVRFTRAMPDRKLFWYIVPAVWAIFVHFWFFSDPSNKKNIPASILYKSIAGRYRPVRVADGPITARYRFIKNASCGVAQRTYRAGTWRLHNVALMQRKRHIHAG